MLWSEAMKWNFAFCDNEFTDLKISRNVRSVWDISRVWGFGKIWVKLSCVPPKRNQIEGRSIKVRVNPPKVLSYSKMQNATVLRWIMGPRVAVNQIKRRFMCCLIANGAVMGLRPRKKVLPEITRMSTGVPRCVYGRNYFFTLIFMAPNRVSEFETIFFLGQNMSLAFVVDRGRFRWFTRPIHIKDGESAQ